MVFLWFSYGFVPHEVCVSWCPWPFQRLKIGRRLNQGLTGDRTWHVTPKRWECVEQVHCTRRICITIYPNIYIYIIHTLYIYIYYIYHIHIYIYTLYIHHIHIYIYVYTYHIVRHPSDSKLKSLQGHENKNVAHPPGPFPDFRMCLETSWP